MGKRVAEKSDKEVRALTYNVDKNKKAYHAVGGDGAHGLVLMCQPPKIEGVKGARSWILRVTIDGKQKEIGLGSYSSVTLRRAREKAKEIRAQVSDGIDPLARRLQERADRRVAQERMVTFAHLMAEYFAIRIEESGARNPTKKIEKEKNQLKSYALPTIGAMVLQEIKPRHIADILKPLRESGKLETSDQVRRNLSRIMSLARAKELYIGNNPADLSVVKRLMPTPTGKKKELNKAQNHPALSVIDVPRFYSVLQNDETLGARLLQFQMLTAARPGEARFAQWDQIDFDSKVWRVPAEDMKKGRAHEVPLSTAALKLLLTMPRVGKFIFSKDGKISASENTASNRLKALHRADILADGVGFVDPMQLDKLGKPRVAVPHGLRSTFKDWTRTTNKYSDELSELALAHQDENKVRAAYARDKLLDDRRPMMADWAGYCQGRFTPKKLADVVNTAHKI